MLNTLYTIGYSGYTIDDFIDVLKKHGINALVDVRSNPFSSYYSAYNRDILSRSLNSNKIHYRSFASEFGAQQSEHCFFASQGYLDFDLYTTSDMYINGYRKIEEGLKRNHSIALMCAERDPIDCHRSIMVARTYHNNDYTILHLLPNSAPMTQFDIEERLLNKYFPTRDQFSVFTAQRSDIELISESYRKRNADIGYRTVEF